MENNVFYATEHQTIHCAALLVYNYSKYIPLPSMTTSFKAKLELNTVVLSSFIYILLI